MPRRERTHHLSVMARLPRDAAYCVQWDASTDERKARSEMVFRQWGRIRGYDAGFDKDLPDVAMVCEVPSIDELRRLFVHLREWELIPEAMLANPGVRVGTYFRRRFDRRWISVSEWWRTTAPVHFRPPPEEWSPHETEE